MISSCSIPTCSPPFPRDQYFYTGIDTFMHCVESLQGSYRNAIIDAFSVRAVQLCEENFPLRRHDERRKPAKK